MLLKPGFVSRHYPGQYKFFLTVEKLSNVSLSLFYLAILTCPERNIHALFMKKRIIYVPEHFSIFTTLVWVVFSFSRYKNDDRTLYSDKDQLDFFI